MKKRTQAYLLVLLFILTSLLGCSNKENNKNTAHVSTDSKEAPKEVQTKDTEMGRYIEHEIALPEINDNEYILKIWQNPDKTFELYTVDTANNEVKLYCYTLKDDMSWDKTIPAWLNNEDYKNTYPSILCMGQDGAYYAVYTDYSNGAKCSIIKSEDGNTTKELNIPYLGEPAKVIDDVTYYPRIENMAVLKNGNLVLNDTWVQDKLLIYSQDGAQLDEVETNGLESFTVSGNILIASDNSATNINLYDTESKKIIKSYDYTYNANGAAYAVKEDGTLLVGDTGGIHRIGKDGTLWETMLDGELSSMSMPSLYINSLYVQDNGSLEEYYAFFSSQDENRLFYYVFDKNVASIPSKQITVYSLMDNSTIRQAISLFQGENPDVKVNYIVAMTGDNDNVSDYIRALNTELLADNGADVIILDSLPVDSYIEKGVLADISDVIEPMAQNGEILSNIAACYNQDGKIYQMPIRFTIPVIYGKKDALDAATNMNSTIHYLNQSGSVPFSAQTTYQNIIKDYLAQYEEEFFSNDQLQEDKFTEFLQNLKSISDNIKAAETLEGYSQITGVSYQSLLFNSPNGLLGIKAGKHSTAMSQISSISDSIMLFALLKDKSLDYQSIQNAFLPSGMVGLNNASQESETAKAFIQFLYSSKVQNADLYDGFPINVTSFKKWADEDNQSIMVGTSDQEGNELTGTWPTKSERDSIYQLATKLNKPIEFNQELNTLITEPILSFLKGDIDINQTVSAVKTKVDTYLSE